MRRGHGTVRRDGGTKAGWRRAVTSTTRWPKTFAELWALAITRAPALVLVRCQILPSTSTSRHCNTSEWHETEVFPEPQPRPLALIETKAMDSIRLELESLPYATDADQESDPGLCSRRQLKGPLRPPDGCKAAGKEALREFVRAQKAPLQHERRTHISQAQESGSTLL